MGKVERQSGAFGVIHEACPQSIVGRWGGVSPRYWLFTIMCAVLATVLGRFVEPCLDHFYPSSGPSISATGRTATVYPRDLGAYYTWKYVTVGYHREWEFLTYQDKPVRRLEFKVALISEATQDVPFTVPVNGEVSDVFVPSYVRYTMNQTQETVDIVFKDLRPGQIVGFSFKVCSSPTVLPFREETVNLCWGKGTGLAWDGFDSAIRDKQDGFWGRLRRTFE